jgi:N-carbamoylputrescine amidase
MIPARDRVTLAVCQTLCLDGDLEGNLYRIERGLQQAKGAGAQLACFPESALIGWGNPAAHRLAPPIPGAWSERVCALAAKYELMVSVGLEEITEEGLYDSAILVSPAGEILLKHRKINNHFTDEVLIDPPYTDGRREDVGAVETGLGRIGVLICADTFWEDLLDRMTALKPDLLLVPYGWAAAQDKWPQHGELLRNLVQKVARTVGCPVVGTDCVGMMTSGAWAGWTYGGQSVVADAEGNVLALGKDREPDVVIVEV